MEPFYGSYMIDTSGMDCWKVIFVRCDWIHEYKTVCELFADCDFERPEINRCRMIPGINPNQPGIPSAHHWYVLRVNSAGTCVEFVDPTTVFLNVDEMVKASAADTTPWYLDAKFTSSDWSIHINLIAWGTMIDLTAHLPTIPTIPDPASACAYWAYLMSIGGVYQLVCDNSALYATRYLSDDTDIAISANTIAYKQIACTIYQWHPLMSHTTAGNPPVTGIEISTSGMYHIRFNSWAYIDDSVGKIRFMLWSTNTGDNPNKTLLLNSKAWVGNTNALSIVDTARGETYQHLSMSEHGLVRLNAGDLITMVMRVDSLNLWAGTVTVEWGWLIEPDAWGWANRAPAGTMALKYCWTTFWVARHSPTKHNTVL
jgi:hypothetical protein